MRKIKLSSMVIFLLLLSSVSFAAKKKTPLDYVNPNIGGIGHLLVATDPVVQLPQGSIRLCSNPWPEIYDRYLADKVFSFSLRDVVRYGTKTIPSWIMATTGNIEVTPAKMASNYDHDFETVSPQSNTQSGNNVGVFANYATSKGEQVEVKIGVSDESIEQAQKNLEKEIPAWNFEAIKNSAKNKWAASLDLFKVEGGTDDQLSIFYTGIYFSNGGESLQNRMKLREDKLVERAQKYAAMSKNELYPSVSSQGGMFQHTNLVMIEDMYLRGIRNFDIGKAYANMKEEFMVMKTQDSCLTGTSAVQWAFTLTQ